MSESDLARTKKGESGKESRKWKVGVMTFSRHVSSLSVGTASDARSRLKTTRKSIAHSRSQEKTLRSQKTPMFATLMKDADACYARGRQDCSLRSRNRVKSSSTTTHPPYRIACCARLARHSPPTMADHHPFPPAAQSAA